MHGLVLVLRLLWPVIAYALGCVLGRLGWKGLTWFLRSAPEETKGVNHGWEYPE